jgi:hypothetical protein
VLGAKGLSPDLDIVAGAQNEQLRQMLIQVRGPLLKGRCEERNFISNKAPHWQIARPCRDRVSQHTCRRPTEMTSCQGSRAALKTCAGGKRQGVAGYVGRLALLHASVVLGKNPPRRLSATLSETMTVPDWTPRPPEVPMRMKETTSRLTPA